MKYSKSTFLCLDKQLTSHQLLLIEHVTMRLMSCYCHSTNKKANKQGNE